MIRLIRSLLERMSIKYLIKLQFKSRVTITKYFL